MTKTDAKSSLDVSQLAAADTGFTAFAAEKGHKRVQRSFKNLNRHASPPRNFGATVDGREGLPEEVGAKRPLMMQQNRAACIGETEMMHRTDFEHNVQNVLSMRNTGTYLNARVIESWINETLSNAEKLEIPGVILKPKQK